MTLARANSEGRDVFPCDFRAKIDFFALNDCLCVIISKCAHAPNMAVGVFSSLDKFEFYEQFWSIWCLKADKDCV